MSINGALKLNVQIVRCGEPAIGPGKALVLEAIDREGSISGADRALGMSHRRIWLLADSLNTSWIEPVVETRTGGGTKAGAQLTPFGRRLLETYRRMEAAMVGAAQGIFKAMVQGWKLNAGRASLIFKGLPLCGGVGGSWLPEQRPRLIY